MNKDKLPTTEQFILAQYQDALQQIEILHNKVFDLEAELFKKQLECNALEVRLEVELAYGDHEGMADSGAQRLIHDITEGE